MNILSTKKRGQPESGVFAETEAELKAFFRVMGETCIFSIIVSELVFLYFLERGISRFPENLIVCLVILSAVLGFVDLFFPDAVVALTSIVSGMTILFIFDFLFGSSTNPYIVPFKEGNAFMDLLFGGAGGLGWIVLLSTIHEFLTTRKLSKRSVTVFLAILVSVPTLYLVSLFSKSIMIFFDEHPWFPATLIGIVTLVVGIIIGRWQKK